MPSMAPALARDAGRGRGPRKVDGGAERSPLIPEGLFEPTWPTPRYVPGRGSTRRSGRSRGAHARRRRGTTTFSVSSGFASLADEEPVYYRLDLAQRVTHSSKWGTDGEEEREVGGDDPRAERTRGGLRPRGE